MCPTLSETAVDSRPSLAAVEQFDRQLHSEYADAFSTEPGLSRSLVSFQANKGRAVYRWYKFKEAFSAGLVEFLLQKYRVDSGSILDPFAGSGTTLFAASALGLAAEGIELLPIGQTIIATKKVIDNGLEEDFATLIRWSRERPWSQAVDGLPVPELRITKGAYPEATVDAIGRFLSAASREDDRVRTILTFPLLCVLESVSYTRKDGQYLRWDQRSGRRQGKRPFDKGPILSFNAAIRAKLSEILGDLSGNDSPDGLFEEAGRHGKVVLHSGSCLEILPGLRPSSFDCVMTSPPYCNRYDYTRTYALELAMLGVDEDGLRRLRQEMLSCTVENRSKDLLSMNPAWEKAIRAADDQKLLQTILSYLEAERAAGRLNNNGIPRMVRGYFYEMACVIAECRRVLKPECPLFMVNDNVRYAGARVSVDLILSDIARKLGFVVERILVLPKGKGNSSQQMGKHGREALRKCVYVWRRK